jgi:hypothetical protein
LIGRLHADSTGGDSEIAVIAAGIIYALDSSWKQKVDESLSAPASNWEKAARSEGLR